MSDRVTEVYRWGQWWRKVVPAWVKGRRPTIRYIPI
jgi:hypothetical protein